MYDFNQTIPDHPWILNPTRFKVLPQQGRAGGSALSSQFFAESVDGHAMTWIGKCGINALTLPAYYSSLGLNRYCEEFLEIVGFTLYRALGVLTPEVGLCPVGVSKQLRRNFPDFHLEGKRYLHVFSQFMEGFSDLGEGFIEAYRTQKAAGNSQFEIEQHDKLMLKGFGQVMAVADYLHDTDWLGNAGGNVGWVLGQNADGQPYAQVVKIDPGAVATFLPGSMVHNPGDERKPHTMSGHDAAARDVWIGTVSGRLSFDDLMPGDQSEFIETARRIIHLPPQALRDLLLPAVCSEGLSQALFEALLAGLLQRQRRLIAAFAPELHAQLQRETLQARAQRVKNQAPEASNAELVALRAQVAALNLEELGTGDCWCFQLPPALPHFTGRALALEQLRLNLYAQEGTVSTQVIHGLGGMGKTQLALHYAHTQQHHYQRILWLYADSVVGLEAQCRELARTLCRIQEPLPMVELIAAIYRALASERVLLVWDNVESHQDIQPFFPPKGTPNSVHSIITSRRSDWGQAPTLTLGEFTEEEGTDYVTTHLNIALGPAVMRLLETVEGYPLALAHAVAYIQQGHSTLEDYPRHFYLHQLAQGHTEHDPNLETVRTSLMLSLLQLREQHPAALMLLRSTVGCAADRIPIQLLAHIRETNLLTLEPRLDILQRYNLIQWNKKQAQISVHRVLHRLLDEDWPDEAAREAHWKKVAEFLTKCLNYDDRDAAGLQLAKTLESHAEACLEGLPLTLNYFRGELLDVLGCHYLYGFGNYARARFCLERALTIHKNDARTAGILANLANSYQALGDDATKQKNLLEQSLIMLQTDSSHTSPQIAAVFSSLAIAYGDLGDKTTKKKLLEQALLIQEKHQGKEHPAVALTLNNLSGVYRDLGDGTKSRLLLERALTIQETYYDKNHPEVALTLTNLGSVYRVLSNPRKALEFLERALHITESHYGNDHPRVSHVLENLANTYCDLGNTSKHKNLLERALLIQETHYNKNHHEIASTLGSLAHAYGTAGDTATQKRLLKRELTIQELHHGKNHPKVAMTLMNLGCAYNVLGNASKQKKLLERALTIYQGHYGDDHPDVALILANLANAYALLGNPVKQKNLAERALALLEQHHGKDHPQVANALVNLAAAYGNLGEDPTRRKRLLERALAIFEPQLGKDHPTVTTVLHNLAHAELALNQPQAALVLAQRCLKARQDFFGPQHPSTQNAQTLVEECHRALDDSSLADNLPDFMSFFNQHSMFSPIGKRSSENNMFSDSAIMSLLQQFGLMSNEDKISPPKMPDILQPTHSPSMFKPSSESALEKAKAFYKQKNFSEALRCFEKALVNREGNISLLHCNVGHCHYNLGQFNEAIESYRASIENDPHRKSAHDWLAKALSAQTSKNSLDTH